MTSPTEDEVAAALTAITCYLADENPLESAKQQSWEWAGSATMVTQGLPITRVPHRPTWGNVERLRRAGRGGTGIIGL